MDLAAGGGFDSRHSEHVNNTEVLLALLTQNKELEGGFIQILLFGGRYRSRLRQSK